MTFLRGMSNVLGDDKRHQIVALGRLGWSLRRIEQATGVRRETASAYLKATGIALRPPGGWGRGPAKPAIEASTDPAAGKPPAEAEPRPGRSPSASACEPYREIIEAASKVGYRPLRYDGLKKVLLGLTTIEEVETSTITEFTA